MDLLCSPKGSKPPLGKATFFNTYRWDGGNFKEYAVRKDRLQWVPMALRTGDGSPNVPFVIHRQPEEFDDDHGFFQSWFFFGLLAEVFCLNQLEDGSRILPEDESTQELDRLYQDFIVEENGKQYVCGSKLLDPTIGDLLAGRWVAHPGGIQARLESLGRCVTFAHSMVGPYRAAARLDPTIHYSICALGEICTTAIGSSGPVLPWGMDYLQPGGTVEAEMLQKGWCKSDLSRIRRVYPRLNTQYFLSCMQKRGSPRSHVDCSQNRCVAAQIVPGEYKLSHATDGCTCRTISIDINEVTRILRDTGSFPILTINTKDDDLEQLTIQVEEYVPEKPYVALSHVWAHGLGNPFENALHRCQMARLADLVYQLNETNKAGSQPLRLWIDTLCCPVELDAKILSLQRMSTVYRKARHVLVLDLAFSSCQSKDAHPALLSLTILACSTWMRRLWTLQEGMLPESVYFQFADKALTLEAIASDLFRDSSDDTRYMAVYQDVQAEAIRLGILLPGYDDYSNAWKTLKVDDTIQRRLWLLQGSLAYRSVSVAEDEPLCIETLLSLEPKVAQINGGPERMAHIWKSLDQAQAIPPKIIFYVDEPLPLHGFGWAPKSLLSVGPDSPLVDYELAGRFDSLLPFTRRADQADPPNPAYQPASLTPSGLKVTYPGFSVSLEPWRVGGSLDGWAQLVPAVEAGLSCRHAASGTWYRLSQNYRNHVVAKWPAERREAYDNKNPWPLREEIKQGNVKLIKNTASEANGIAVYLMVRTRNEGGHSHEDLEVEVLHSVAMAKFDAANSQFLDMLAQISREASEKLLATENGNGGQTGTSTFEILRDVAMEFSDKTPLFEPLFRSIIGFFDREKAWLALPMWLPLNLVLEDMPSDQTWIVDKRNI